MMTVDEVEKRYKPKEGFRFFKVDKNWDFKRDKLKTRSHVLPDKAKV